MTSVRPIHFPILALLTLVPVAAYMADTGATVVVLSLLSVVIVSASLYYMFGLSEDDDSPTGEADEPTTLE